MPTDTPPCLLTYIPYTWPEPLQVSTDIAPATGRINIDVSADTPVYCSQIIVSVQVQNLDQSLVTDLFAQQPDSAVSTNKWSPTFVIRTGRELGLDPETVFATFIYTCASTTDRLIDYRFGLSVFGVISELVGDTQIYIDETSGTDPDNLTEKQCTLPVTKAAPTFYLTNLTATTPTTPSVTTTDFAAGAPIRFAWESNGTYFQVFAKGDPNPVYQGVDTTFTLTGGVNRDSTFVLVGSVTGNAPLGSYQPIYLYDSITVTVSDPVLAPSSVEVSGPLTGHGTTTLADTSVNGTLGVRDTTTLGTTIVNGRLTANADAILGDTTVTRGLTARGGRVAMLGQIVQVASGAEIAGDVVAKTDGFVLATVSAPPRELDSCFAKASIYVASLGRWFETLGGTVGSFGPKWSYLMQGNPSSICVPVAAGERWRYKGTNASGMQALAPIAIYWLPIGTGALEGETVTFAHDVTNVPEPPPLIGPHEFAEARSAAAVAFIERLEEFFENPLPSDSREHLAGLLTEL